MLLFYFVLFIFPCYQYCACFQRFIILLPILVFITYYFFILLIPISFLNSYLSTRASIRKRIWCRTNTNISIDLIPTRFGMKLILQSPNINSKILLKANPGTPHDPVCKNIELELKKLIKFHFYLPPLFDIVIQLHHAIGSGIATLMVFSYAW